MAASQRKYLKRTASNKAKKVSFQDLNEPFEKQEVDKQTSEANAPVHSGKTNVDKKLEMQKVRKWTDKDEYDRREEAKKSSVEISELFTSTDLNLRSSTTPQTEETKVRTPRKPKLSIPQTPVVRKAEKIPSFKHPTESLSHALLRTMSHHDSAVTRRSLPKLVVWSTDARLTAAEDKNVLMRKLFKMKQEQMMKSPEDAGDAFQQPTESHAEVVTSARSVDATSPLRIDIRCDVCRKEQKVNPASGFCKFCDEFLCAKCIHVHKSRVTRCHPVIVFHCDTCKELNILNRKGAAFCVKCKRYYCSVCVVQHCSRTNHDVLEGDDLLDVVEATTQVST